MTCDREAARQAFLRDAGLAGARREPLAGDASTRRYERLHRPSGPSLILMDQPPAVESPPCPPDATSRERAELGGNALERLAAGRVDAFVACAGWLRGRGLSAPAVIAADPTAGLALLEDLGDGLFARVLEAGGDEAALYDAAIDALLDIQEETPPATLPAGAVSWPLLDYDDLALKTAGDFFVDWLPRLCRQLTFSSGAREDWDAVWAPVRARGALGAKVFCHRDYHAENLIWLPARKGAARVGMLDFQDAVRAHPAWDLSMLVHDARRDVSLEREAAVLNRYLAAKPDMDADTLRADFHALGALNIVRILGKFSRLVARDNKARYRALMPRMWRYLDRCLAGPAPPGLANWLGRHVPAELRG